MLETMLVTLNQLISSIPHGVIIFFMFIIGWKLYDKITPYKFNDELVEKDNAAVGVALTGFIIALGIGLAGTLFGAKLDVFSSVSGSSEIVMIFANSAIIIVLTILSGFITDKILLSKFSVYKELVEDKNVGTGFIVAGNFIASGIVLNGAMTGKSETTMFAFRDIFIYWIIGQIFVIIAGIIYQLITKYDLHKEIEERDNAAVGISFAGFIISVAWIMRAAILNATSNIIAEIGTIIVIGVVGFILLLIMRVVADKILMPSSPLSLEVSKQKNCAAAGIAFASFLLVAIIISSAVTNVTMQPKISSDSTLQSAISIDPIQSDDNQIEKGGYDENK